MNIDDLKECIKNGNKVCYENKMWDVCVEPVVMFNASSLEEEGEQEVIYLKSFRRNTVSTPNDKSIIKVCGVETVFIDDNVLKDIQFIRTRVEETVDHDENGNEVYNITFTKVGSFEKGTDFIK